MIVLLLGKSGAGKTSVQKYFHDNLGYSTIISSTTRPCREGEQSGKDYYFLTEDEFISKLNNGEFVEYTKYRDWYYGIEKKELLTKQDSFLVTDIVGFRNLKRLGIKVCSIYIESNDKDRYIRQLERGDDIIEVALRSERDKACFQDVYLDVDYIVRNEDLSECVFQIKNYIEEYKMKGSL